MFFLSDLVCICSASYSYYDDFCNYGSDRAWNFAAWILWLMSVTMRLTILKFSLDPRACNLYRFLWYCIFMHDPFDWKSLSNIDACLLDLNAPMLNKFSVDLCFLSLPTWLCLSFRIVRELCASSTLLDHNFPNIQEVLCFWACRNEFIPMPIIR